MNDKNKKSITDANPYRFDLTGDFISDGHDKISATKNRIKTEAKIRKEQKNNGWDKHPLHIYYLLEKTHPQ